MQLVHHEDGTITLEPQYLLKLLNFISKKAYRELRKQRQDIVWKRRGFFNDKKWDEYRLVVIEWFKLYDQKCQ